MDEKYLWPLVGVALGWLLSLVATTLKDRAEDRRKVGRLVSQLLIVLDQLDTLVIVCEHIKDHVDGWESYERMRKRITAKHFLEPASHVESLRKCIDEVAGIYPVQALDLHGLLDMLLKNKQASLVEMSKSRDLYIRAISVYEVGLTLIQRRLKRIIRRLSASHGWTTLVRVLYRERKKVRNRQHGSEFAEKFTEDSFAELKRAEPTAETPNPSLERTSTGMALGPRGAQQ